MNHKQTHLQPRVLETMRSIASKPSQENPFYVLELEDIVNKVQQFQRLMPRVEIFYAVKHNNHRTVLETLASLETSFYCSSKGEIQKVLSLGVSPSRIIYAHPYKSKLDLKFASKVQVSLITFDSREELMKIHEIYPEAELVLRINFDAPQFDDAFVEDSISLLHLARELSQQVIGVSIHVESECKGFDVYRRAIAAVRQIFDEGKELGMDMNLLDIGSCFPGRHNCRFESFVSVINEALDIHFPAQTNNSLRVVAEPGRYIVTSAFTLCSQIISRRRVQNDNQITNMYYVNAGVFNAFWVMVEEPEMLMSPRVLTLKGQERRGSHRETVETCKIWGPTCCPFDLLHENVKLPPLECGDYLYWQDMGVDTLTVSTKFNGYPKPKVHLVKTTLPRR